MSGNSDTHDKARRRLAHLPVGTERQPALFAVGGER